MIESAIFRALGYLFIAGIVNLIYSITKNNAQNGKCIRVLWKGLLFAVVIAYISSITLGNATCEYGSDPVYGGCEQYADDGYNPTGEQRVANFIYTIVLLYVPVIFGAYSKKLE